MAVRRCGLSGTLRHYRNRQQKHDGNSLLVIVGHSFGGMIVVPHSRSR